MAECTICSGEGRVKCPECKGHPDEADCAECDGYGQVEQEVIDENGEDTGRLEEVDCEACEGWGHFCEWCDDIGSVDCDHCFGSGEVAYA